MANEAIPDVKKLDDGLGGAIYINSSSATINKNIFNNNVARNGSAIYYDKSGLNCIISDNAMAEIRHGFMHCLFMLKHLLW